jgi:hypothetical protein
MLNRNYSYAVYLYGILRGRNARTVSCKARIYDIVTKLQVWCRTKIKLEKGLVLTKEKLCEVDTRLEASQKKCVFRLLTRSTAYVDTKLLNIWPYKITLLHGRFASLLRSMNSVTYGLSDPEFAFYSGGTYFTSSSYENSQNNRSLSTEKSHAFNEVLLYRLKIGVSSVIGGLRSLCFFVRNNKFPTLDETDFCHRSSINRLLKRNSKGILCNIL